MKKIIEHGKPKHFTRRFVCVKCGCVFEADNEDYKFHILQNDECYISNCPECGGASYSPVQKGGA